MKKKIIGLIVGISVVAALLGTGTLAFFTDTETTAPNTFTAGVIDITIEQPATTVWSGEISDLKPSMTGYTIIKISSTAASNEMELWKRINTPTPDENGIVEPECAAYGGSWADSACTGGTAKNDIDKYIHFDMWIESDTDPDPKTVTPDGAEDEWIIQESAGWLLSNNASTADTDNFDPSVRDPSVNGVVGNWIYLGKIGPGEDTMIIVQSFHMDSYVQNWAQTDKISFTEEILAQQTTPLADPPSPILTDEGRP